MDPDGALQDNLKSNVYKVLKRMMNTDALPNINTIIADGMFFNQITPHCLNWCIFMQKFVSFVAILTQHRTAEYLSLSKTQKRGNEESDHVSSIGPKVKMETDMHGFLRLSCFREELFSFFFKEIEGQIYAEIIVSKLLYIAIDKKM